MQVELGLAILLVPTYTMFGRRTMQRSVISLRQHCFSTTEEIPSPLLILVISDYDSVDA
jgi:hypothetical protein